MTDHIFHWVLSKCSVFLLESKTVCWESVANPGWKLFGSRWYSRYDGLRLILLPRKRSGQNQEVFVVFHMYSCNNQLQHVRKHSPVVFQKNFKMAFTEDQRVPNRFFGMWDSMYFMAGMRDRRKKWDAFRILTINGTRNWKIGLSILLFGGGIGRKIGWDGRI